MRIAFYAPLKAPNHAVPSGDRRMARLFMQALAEIGAEVFLASDFRSYDGFGSAENQTRLQRHGEATARELLAGYQSLAAGARPDLWFTYHLYHKAPDWLGPTISAALGIPYVVAEASHAPKQAGGAWDRGYRAAAAAIKAARRVLAMTRLDLACLEALPARSGHLSYFPPFIDTAPFAGSAADRAGRRAELAGRHGLDLGQPWLLSVAMMRPGDKLRSYQVLAASLEQLRDKPWQAILVGDGAARDEVADLFKSFGERVVLARAQGIENLLPYYCASDIYLWPAVNEAYGMAFLEAQAAGLPVVAGAEPGVGEVIRDGVSGLLCAPGEVAEFTPAVARLLQDKALRKNLGRGARAFVNGERDVKTATAMLAGLLSAKSLEERGGL